MKAYEVTIRDWRNFRAIVAAESPGSAKAQQHRAAADADYPLRFTEFRVKRAPEFDNEIKNPEIAVWGYTLGHEDSSGAWGCLKTAT